MKKIIPVIAVLGSAVAFAVYKMKKEEQKELMDLDEGLLREDEFEFNDTEEKTTEPAFAPQPEVDDIAKLMKESSDEISKAVAGEEAEYSDEYPHLTVHMMDDIRTMTKEAIQALANDGDVHEHERPVQHMVGFKVKEDMEGFKSRVINKGFVITKGEGEYDLVVLHISMIDEEKLISNVLYLADQVSEFHGTYRGWQSKVSN